MNKPLVSVIIPFFENREWLDEALNSAYNQTYKNKELILINDGSKEDINDILNKYDGIIYKKIDNSGPGIARNIGIELSKGEYIAFLDSDDYWVNSKLDKQMDFMLEKGVVWSHTSYELFGEKIKNTIVQMPRLEGKIFPKNLYSSKMATPCVMIKSVVIKENNFFFANDMRTGQDGFLWLQLSVNYPVGYLNEPLTKVRIRGTNSSKNYYSQIRTRAQLYNKIKTNYPTIAKKNINMIGKYAYLRCVLIYKIVNMIYKKKKITRLANLIFFLLYLPSWIFFKFAYYLKGKK